MLHPIQTEYRGCLFRSRLEARWAVFFDKAKIKWLYEPEGYTITGPGYEGEEERWNYLPDFFLPETKTWIEVKPDFKTLDEDYLYMLQWAVDWGGQLPGICDSNGTTRGLLMLSSIPYPEGFAICHPILQHYKGGYVNITVFIKGGIKIIQSNENQFDATWGDKTCIRKDLMDIDCFEHTEPQPQIIRQAYVNARKARFEFGG